MLQSRVSVFVFSACNLPRNTPSYKKWWLRHFLNKGNWTYNMLISICNKRGDQNFDEINDWRKGIFMKMSENVLIVSHVHFHSRKAFFTIALLDCTGYKDNVSLTTWFSITQSHKKSSQEHFKNFHILPFQLAWAEQWILALIIILKLLDTLFVWNERLWMHFGIIKS